VASGHHPVVVKASTRTVHIYRHDDEIARHERCWTREQQVFDPLHYLPLLQRKPGSLDDARPLQHWALPEAFGLLRRRLEADRQDGTREYIRVLMLLREYRLEHVTIAVQHALRWGAPTADAIKQLLIPDERPEQRTFRLDGREHLAGVRVDGGGPGGLSRRPQGAVLRHHGVGDATAGKPRRPQARTAAQTA
jgi:hypothetical protein